MAGRRATLRPRRGWQPKRLPGDYRRGEGVSAAWHGGSDRGTVLVLAAQLETLVDAALRKSLTGCYRQGRHPLLDGPAAPAGNWFSKNLLLFHSGIISERLWRDIERVREIRDRFAQDWSCDSFEDPKIHAQLVSFNSLSSPAGAANESDADRSVFIDVVISLMKGMEEVCKRTRARQPKADEQVYREG